MRTRSEKSLWRAVAATESNWIDRRINQSASYRGIVNVTFIEKWTTQKFPVLRNAAQDHAHLNSTGTFVNNLSRMMQSTIGFSTPSSLPFVSLICIVVEKLSKFHGTGTTHRDRKFVVPRAFFAVLKNLSGRCVCVVCLCVCVNSVVIVILPPQRSYTRLQSQWDYAGTNPCIS